MKRLKRRGRIDALHQAPGGGDGEKRREECGCEYFLHIFLIQIKEDKFLISGNYLTLVRESIVFFGPNILELNFNNGHSISNKFD